MADAAIWSLSAMELAGIANLAKNLCLSQMVKDSIITEKQAHELSKTYMLSFIKPNVVSRLLREDGYKCVISKVDLES